MLLFLAWLEISTWICYPKIYFLGEKQRKNSPEQICCHRQAGRQAVVATGQSLNHEPYRLQGTDRFRRNFTLARNMARVSHSIAFLKLDGKNYTNITMRNYETRKSTLNIKLERAHANVSVNSCQLQRFPCKPTSDSVPSKSLHSRVTVTGVIRTAYTIATGSPCWRTRQVITCHEVAEIMDVVAVVQVSRPAHLITL